MRHDFKKSEPRMKVEFLGGASPVDASQPGLPLYLSPVEAGFPSPAEDYLDKRLNLVCTGFLGM